MLRILGLLSALALAAPAGALTQCVVGRAGRCDGQAIGTQATVNPKQLAFDPIRDQLVIADYDGFRARAMHGGSHLMTMLAQPSGPQARPIGVAADAGGRYFSTLDGFLYHVRNDGTWTPLPVAGIAKPWGLAVCGGALWVADFGPGTLSNNSVWRLSPPFATAVPERMTVAGAVRRPAAVACLGSDVLIVDDAGHRVWRRSAAGALTPFAGTGVSGFSGDGGAATAAQLNFPAAIAVDGSDVYVADGNRVRRVRGGVISTVLGSGAQNPTHACPMMGTPDNEIAISSPSGVAIDPVRRVLYAGSTVNGFVLGTTLDAVASTPTDTPVAPTATASRTATRTLPPTVTASATATSTPTVACPPGCVQSM